MKRPLFSSNTSDLIVHGLVHPILASRVFGFVPNDLEFTRENHCYVLTGPNMGGKSTILREVGLAVILAQMGSFVPADYMLLSPVDCIFTRLGASDSLIEGKSTFYLEMEEASKVFKRGTPKSLVIMDELGRGTSTEDGSAIALATLQKLTAGCKPRALFTTHYHMILADIRDIDGIIMAHMDSLANEIEKTVTFLYKLKKGECPRSYGLNVAKIAGITDCILNSAYKIAAEIEKKQKMVLITEMLKKLKLAGVEDPLPYLNQYLN